MRCNTYILLTCSFIVYHACVQHCVEEKHIVKCLVAFTNRTIWVDFSFIFGVHVQSWL